MPPSRASVSSYVKWGLGTALSPGPLEIVKSWAVNFCIALPMGNNLEPGTSSSPCFHQTTVPLGVSGIELLRSPWTRSIPKTHLQGGGSALYWVLSVDSWEYLGNSPEPLEPQFADYDIEVMMVFTLAPGSISKSNRTLSTYMTEFHGILSLYIMFFYQVFNINISITFSQFFLCLALYYWHLYCINNILVLLIL